MMNNSNSVFGKLGGAVAAILAIASLVYAFVAEISNPPMFPAAEVIALQSEVMGGVYYMKLTFIVTWFLLLTPVAILAMLVAAVSQVRSRQSPASSEIPSGPQWSVVHRRNRAMLAIAGLLMLVPGATFLTFLFTDPSSLVVLSYLSIVGLIAAPLLSGAGLGFLLDGLLAPQRTIGNIQSMAAGQYNGRPTGFYTIVVAGRSFQVANKIAQPLSVGTHVGLSSTALFNIVMEIQVHQPGYRG